MVGTGVLRSRRLLGLVFVRNDAPGATVPWFRNFVAGVERESCVETVGVALAVVLGGLVVLSESQRVGGGIEGIIIVVNLNEISSICVSSGQSRNILGAT